MVSSLTPVKPRISTYGWASPQWPNSQYASPKSHTMGELRFSGNYLYGSRPILYFSPHFATAPHLQAIKELLTHVFSVPKCARKPKPFIDHILGFTIADGKIRIRCYHINEIAISKTGDADPVQDPPSTKKLKGAKPERGDTKISLVEIGPRFVLTTIVNLESSFGGPVKYENKELKSPNPIRIEIRMSKVGRYTERTAQGQDRNGKKEELGLRTGEGEWTWEGWAERCGPRCMILSWILLMSRIHNHMRRDCQLRGSLRGNIALSKRLKQKQQP